MMLSVRGNEPNLNYIIEWVNMFKITFLGAGSTVFAKNVIGDCILTEELGDFEVALFDIDAERLEDSKIILENINKKYNGKAKIVTYLNRKEALRDAKYVVNAVQIGGYDPCTITDFKVPEKFGLSQTIGDTLGIGGIFRALRTIPVMEEFAEDIENVCKDALFLNYVNPMCMITGYMQRYTKIKTIGLCHSVQICVPHLLDSLDMSEYTQKAKWMIAGINHQAWLLNLEDENGNDLYPEVKKRSLDPKYHEKIEWDLVRHEIMHRFGYYNTESSVHTAEYNPYFIKRNYPELIERYKISIGEYLKRCVDQIDGWKKLRADMIDFNKVVHEKSNEFASSIIKATLTDVPVRIHGNVINNGLITNLPSNACVEVPCMVDRNGINPCYVGALPEQLAALNRTNINVQLMTIQASQSRRKEDVYMAAYLDPHTSAELSMDDIKAMCDELFKAHGSWMPQYK